MVFILHCELENWKLKTRTHKQTKIEMGKEYELINRIKQGSHNDCRLIMQENIKGRTGLIGLTVAQYNSSI